MQTTERSWRLSLIAGLALAMSSGPAPAATLKTIYNFYSTPGDGIEPDAGLAIGPNGALYGTTEYGGAFGYGTVFELTPAADGSFSEAVIYNFTGGAFGANPVAVLIIDPNGALYGTTEYGGSGLGTVFKLTPGPPGTYTESVLHSFSGSADGPDGEFPAAGLLADAQGALYGTTYLGGSHALGTVFKLTPANDGTYTESVIYSFEGSPDGASPVAGLVMDSAGALYGTTINGGACHGAICSEGTVFKLTPGEEGTYTESVLHSFFTIAGGSFPEAALVMDPDGALYGATSFGGANGGGTVFELTPRDGSYRYRILYSFDGRHGAFPGAALLRDARPVLYGTTEIGGGSHRVCPSGCGTVFRVREAGVERVLVRFDGSDGALPAAGLVSPRPGVFYGTTSFGGANGGGTVFEVLEH